jgi:hypothetical protein
VGIDNLLGSIPDSPAFSKDGVVDGGGDCIVVVIEVEVAPALLCSGIHFTVEALQMGEGPLVLVLVAFDMLSLPCYWHVLEDGPDSLQKIIGLLSRVRDEVRFKDLEG